MALDTSIGVDSATKERLKRIAGDVPVARFLRVWSLEVENGRTPLPGTGHLSAPLTAKKEDINRLEHGIMAFVEKGNEFLQVMAKREKEIFPEFGPAFFQIMAAPDKPKVTVQEIREAAQNLLASLDKIEAAQESTITAVTS